MAKILKFPLPWTKVLRFPVPLPSDLIRESEELLNAFARDFIATGKMPENVSEYVSCAIKGRAAMLKNIG